MPTKKKDEDYFNVSSFKVSFGPGDGEVYESVAGLGLQIEDIVSQGERNLFNNRPGRCNASDLVLTRQYRKDNELYQWIKDTKEGKKRVKDGSVVLLDGQNNEVSRFNFSGA